MANTLAKNGRHKEHWLPTEPHEYAHTTLYFFHKDRWIGMHQTPYKGPIRHFSRYLIKHANDNYLVRFGALEEVFMSYRFGALEPVDSQVTSGIS
jgi:hypothetical protein